jgi:hypothetical protein
MNKTNRLNLEHYRAKQVRPVFTAVRPAAVTKRDWLTIGCAAAAGLAIAALAAVLILTL